MPTDVPAYPRTYRPAPGWFVFSRVFALALFLAGGWITGGLARIWPIHVARPADVLIWAGLAVLTLGGSVYMTFSMGRVRLTLENDAVEFLGYGTPLAMLHLRRPPRMARADIVALKRTHNRGAQRLIVRDRYGRTMRIPMIFRTDAAFRAWFKPFRDA